MFLAVPNALAKDSENEKSPSPTSKISWDLGSKLVFFLPCKPKSNL